jgi:hypothetical protein
VASKTLLKNWLFITLWLASVEKTRDRHYLDLHQSIAFASKRSQMQISVVYHKGLGQYFANVSWTRNPLTDSIQHLCYDGASMCVDTNDQVRFYKHRTFTHSVLIRGNSWLPVAIDNLIPEQKITAARLARFSQRLTSRNS